MTHRVRPFSLVLIGPVVLVVLALAGVALAGGTFEDDDSNYHEPMIEAIAAEGLTVGCSTDPPLYCPGDEVLRSGMATFIARSLGEEGNLPSYQGYFADVPEGEWYTPYVERLYELGITEGCDTDPLRFCPLESVLRSEMAVFLVRQVEGDTGLPDFQGYFGDVAEGEWYTQHVERLYELEITLGCVTDPLKFCPDGLVLRDQMASFLARTLGLDPVPICDFQSSIPSIECEALVALYDSTNGTDWANSMGWLTDPDPCMWDGVICGGGSVVQLELENHGLSGPMPPELGDLANLTELSFYGNQLSGSIPPELGNLTNLERLMLYANLLSGPIPPELGDLTSLTTVAFNFNQLSGPIPPELGALTNLKYLSLRHNQLSGSIPPQLGNLANLDSLDFGSNRLSGSIPPELGDLANLRELDFVANQLSGSIPPQLGNLTNLYWGLNLGSNQLSGSIPPQLGSLTNLRHLTLAGNQISGSIPPELGDLNSVKTVNLADNHLSGPVPPALELLPMLNAGGLGLSGQSGCLTAATQSFADWLTTFSPGWNDGCSP